MKLTLVALHHPLVLVRRGLNMFSAPDTAPKYCCFSKLLKSVFCNKKKFYNNVSLHSRWFWFQQSKKVFKPRKKTWKSRSRWKCLKVFLYVVKCLYRKSCFIFIVSCRVWPDSTKFRHFGKYCKSLMNFVQWQNFKLTRAKNLNTIGQSFMEVFLAKHLNPSDHTVSWMLKERKKWNEW